MNPTAGQEWKRYWTLPIAAAMGNVGAAIHIYSLGAFMVPLEEAFDWSRAQISFGITISNGSTALLGILIGWLVDRWGPRKVGILGILIMATAFGSLGTATGTYSNWVFLWFLIAIGAAWTQPTIWTSAVATRFNVSRGLALALTISGTGLAATLLPILATSAIANFGWRYAFFIIAGGWTLISMPMVLLFFRGKADRQSKTEKLQPAEASSQLTGQSAAQTFRSATFYRLAVAGGLFAFCSMGLIVHFVPVLTDRGLSPIEAAGIAGLIGLSSIAGRLGTGLLLDRFRAERIALVAFALPTVTALLLIYGESAIAYSAAAIVMGFSLGAELDVIIYLTTRHFGLKRFGVIFATMLVFLTIGTASGPVSAGAIFDNYGSYVIFLIIIIPMVLTASLLVGTLAPAPDPGAQPLDKP